MLRWGRVAVAYLVLGAVALILVWGRGGPIWLHPTAEPTSALSSHAWSLAIGLGFGVVVVLLSRVLVQRFAWARHLHRELRPFALSLDRVGLVSLALLSGAGEELLFRGMLQPWIGLWPQALVFGLAHQLPGASRWVWCIWAFLVGLALGLLFEVSGSILGPILAHAFVNGVNLAFLRQYDPDRSEITEGAGLHV